MPKKLAPHVLLWVDTETTGLNPGIDHIVEIAGFLTDAHGNLAGQPYHRIIPCSVEEWDQTIPEVKTLHHRNGLADLIVPLTTLEAIKNRAAEDTIFANWIDGQVSADHQIILAGSSVHFDYEMLRADMPQTFSLLHYRLLDVTSIMYLMQSVTGENPDTAGHGSTHRALTDIEDSYRYFMSIRERLSRKEPR